jgi:hypothetical protein
MSAPSATLTFAQAVAASKGQISYAQLWRGVRNGKIAATQPSGPRGRYMITRQELERLLTPIKTQK